MTALLVFGSIVMLFGMLVGAVIVWLFQDVDKPLSADCLRNLLKGGK